MLAAIYGLNFVCVLYIPKASLECWPIPHSRIESFHFVELTMKSTNMKLRKTSIFVVSASLRSATEISLSLDSRFAPACFNEIMNFLPASKESDTAIHE